MRVKIKDMKPGWIFKSDAKPLKYAVTNLSNHECTKRGVVTLWCMTCFMLNNEDDYEVVGQFAIDGMEVDI